MKKIILGLGALTAVITPVAFAADCGGKSSKTTPANIDQTATKTPTTTPTTPEVKQLTPAEIQQQNEQDIAAVKAGITIGGSSRISHNSWNTLVSDTPKPFSAKTFDLAFQIDTTAPNDLRGVQLTYKITKVNFSNFKITIFLTKGTSSDTAEFTFVTP